MHKLVFFNCTWNTYTLVFLSKQTPRQELICSFIYMTYLHLHHLFQSELIIWRYNEVNFSSSEFRCTQHYLFIITKRLQLMVEAAPNKTDKL